MDKITKMKIGLLYSTRGKLKERYATEDWIGRDTDDTKLITDALVSKGHEVELITLPLENLQEIKEKNFDVIFNLCDEGYACNAQLEPHIPALLDLLGVPYTGSDYITLANCLNKARTKEILSFHGIPTPKFQVFRTGDEILDKSLRFPLIAKPSKEDASVGIRDDSIVENEAALKKKVKEVITKYNQDALVEEFIDGRELNVAILGNDSHDILPISEIIFNLPEGKRKICGYDAKWLKNSQDYEGTVPSCPAEIDLKTEQKIKKTALNAYRIMGCKGYGRVDIRFKENTPYVIEINPNPDISVDAGLARIAGIAGMDYAQLLDRIAILGANNKKLN